MPPSPNILIFCVDEMRADHLGCAGNPTVRTPNLDRLAARGMLFSRAYCANPICMPARASMFTGMLPRDHGLRVNGQNLRREVPTLPGTLAEAGYRTHAAGKLHLTAWVPKVEPPEPRRYPECKDYWDRGVVREFPTPYYGFHSVDYVGGHTSWAYGDYGRWLRGQGGAPEQLLPDEPIGDAPSSFRMRIPEKLHYNRYVADSVIDLIEDSAGPDAPPFFAWCSFPDPHMPVGSPEPYRDMYDPAEVELPVRREGELDDLPPVYRRVMRGELRPNGVDSSGVTDADWREIIAGTYGMITHLDAEVGRVLDALERAGLAEDTVVAFISDHGDMMGDHGLLWKSFYTFQGCIRLPLIVSAPGCPDGRVSDALVSQIDLMPTILDLCEVPTPGEEWREAETPYERGSVVPLRPYPGHSWRPLLEGSTERLREEVVIENDDPTCGFQVRALVTDRHRLTIYPATPHGELFDLQADPDELHNLWYQENHSDLRAALTARLLDAYSRATPLYPIPPWNA